MKVPNYIEVETSRYCNRQCEWCPNHPLQNRKKQELLPWVDLETIVGSLSRVQYRGWFAFHNYNEPLSNPRLLDEVSYVRSALPQAKITIYTNGDRLNVDIFEALAISGITQMRVTLYPKSRDAAVASHLAIRHWLARKKFLRAKDWSEVVARQGPALIHTGPPEVILISPEVEQYYDRGGLIPWLSLENRTKPCFLTSNSLSIDYEGNIKMCCNVVTGSRPHNGYFFGSVRDNDIIEVWNSSRFEAMRGCHQQSDWSLTPICTTCRQHIEPMKS